MTPRHLLIIVMVTPLIVQCGGGGNSSTPLTLSTELGGGYNQYVYDIDNGLLLKSGVKWVRGYVNIPRNFLEFSNECTIDGGCAVIGVLDGNISELPDRDSGNTEILAISALTKLAGSASVITASGERVKVILSLKTDFKYKNMGIPQVDSPAMTYMMSAIHQVLEQNNLGGYVDIVVAGNEPMYETPLDDPHEDAAEYGQFLQMLIGHLEGLKTPENGWKYEIFTGALDKANQARNDPQYGPIIQEILDITKHHDDVDGIDLHLHVEGVDNAEADVHFVRHELGTAKKIISTEFSLVGLWDKHRNERLGPWGPRHGYPADWELHRWINRLQEQAAEGQPISQAVFLSYFNQQRWYPRNWFSMFVDIFNNPSYDVYAATYGLESTPEVPPVFYDGGSHLWYLNFVYNCTLLGRAANGYCNTNPLVFPEFRAAINGTR